MTHISFVSQGSTKQVFQAVQEQCFLWVRVTAFGNNFGFCHFNHAQKCSITQYRKGKNPKSIICCYSVDGSKKIQLFPAVCCLALWFVPHLFKSRPWTSGCSWCPDQWLAFIAEWVRQLNKSRGRKALALKALSLGSWLMPKCGESSALRKRTIQPPGA